jgi:hypothetical protein
LKIKTPHEAWICLKPRVSKGIEGRMLGKRKEKKKTKERIV